VAILLPWRLSPRRHAFRSGRSLTILPSIMGGWAAHMGNVGWDLATIMSSGDNFDHSSKLQRRRFLSSNIQNQAHIGLKKLGIAVAEFSRAIDDVPAVELQRSELPDVLSVVGEWDRKTRRKYNDSETVIPCPICGEAKNLSKIGSANIVRDLGLHHPTENLVRDLEERIGRISWNMRNITSAYRAFYQIANVNCDANVFICNACLLHFINSRWVERSVNYQNQIVRDNEFGLFGRGHDAGWARKKASMAAYAEETFGPLHNKKILEIGCAEGLCLSQMAYLGGRVTGVELNESAVHYARNVMGIERIECRSYEEEAFDKHDFDLVISHHVIEHTVDPDAFIRSIKHHLRPNGFTLLQCPIARSGFHAVENSHPIGLTTGTLVRSFRRHGFSIVSVQRPNVERMSDPGEIDPDTGTLWSGAYDGGISIIAQSL
jgi:2-polyprenyl-3-methyl-5-hydroxy-6-metoxy-1,4-benzoquinol methylase